MHVDKKLLTLPIIIMIALSIVGVGVAHWLDQVVIYGQVEMAGMTLAFKEIEPCTEYYWKDDVRYPGEPKGKNDTATPTSWLTDFITDAHSGKSGYEKMHIKIDNAYPEYEVHCTFVVHNIGTICLNITGLNITDPTGDLTFTGSGTSADPWVGTNIAGNEVLNVWSVDLVGEELQPCIDEKAELDIHFKETAEECHTYKFEVTILYGQRDP